MALKRTKFRITSVQTVRNSRFGDPIQHEYLYWGANVSVKRQIIKLLVHGNGVTDIASVVKVV